MMISRFHYRLWKVNNLFYVYIDYTTEDSPRPFYVGKGSHSRVKNLIRNNKHKWVKKYFGFNRVVVYETLNEKEALDKEIELISEHKTFALDKDASSVASNFTRGGEGTKGVNCRQVLQLDMSGRVIEIHESIEAANLAIGSNVVGNALRGVRKFNDVKGFIWMYASVPRKHKRKPNKRRINTMKVIENRVDETIIYDSVTDAALAANIDRAKLKRIMLGDGNYNGSNWRYENVEKALQTVGRKDSIEARAAKSRSSKGTIRSESTKNKIRILRSKPINQFDLNGNLVGTFLSVKEAYVSLGLAKSALLAALHNGTEYHNFLWKFVYETHNKRQGHKFDDTFRAKISKSKSTKVIVKNYDGETLNTYTPKEYCILTGLSINILRVKTRDNKTFVYNGNIISREPS